MPGTSPELPVELTKTAESTDDGPDGTLLTTSLGPAASAQGMAGETDMQGIYEVQLATRDNRTLHQRFALNVDPRESQLDVMDRNALRSLLEPIDVRIHRAEDQFDLSGNVERNSWSEFLLWFLIVALLIEQYLAYRLSYHAYAMQPAGGTS
jgi:hypothetical protein